MKAGNRQKFEALIQAACYTLLFYLFCIQSTGWPLCVHFPGNVFLLGPTFRVVDSSYVHYATIDLPSIKFLFSTNDNLQMYPRLSLVDLVVLGAIDSQVSYHMWDNVSPVCLRWWISVFLDGKVHGANMGPIWGRQDPGGPHVGSMNLAI